MNNIWDGSRCSSLCVLPWACFLLCCWGEGVSALCPRAEPVSSANAAPGVCGAVYGHWLQPGLILLDTFHARREKGTSERQQLVPELAFAEAHPFLQAELRKINLKCLAWVPGEGGWWGHFPTSYGAWEPLLPVHLQFYLMRGRWL